MESKFVFVILHYQSIQDTIKCIDSILNISSNDYKIVVIDNNSPNKSGIELERIYKKNWNIKIIRSSENTGFAKGNNIGYKYAKKNWNPDYIITLNNDIVINQLDFLKKIEEAFEQTSFHILGPSIFINNEKNNQNPSVSNFKYKKNSIKKEILKRKKWLFQLKYNIYRPYTFIDKVQNKLSRKSSRKNPYLKLHGSCLVFSKEYIKSYNGFFSKTFMYMEEDILSYIAKNEKMNIVFYKDLEVFHKEDGATDSIYKTDIDKFIFKYKNEIESLIEFHKILDDSDYYKNDILVD